MGRMTASQVAKIFIFTESEIARCIKWKLTVEYKPGYMVISETIPLKYKNYVLMSQQDAQFAAEEYLDKELPGWREV